MPPIPDFTHNYFSISVFSVSVFSPLFFDILIPRVNAGRAYPSVPQTDQSSVICAYLCHLKHRLPCEKRSAMKGTLPRSALWLKHGGSCLKIGGIRVRKFSEHHPGA